jgi:hypothetical protein
MQRLIGEFSSILGGPTLFCTAGIHGSEPAGVVAAERVVKHLRDSSIPVRGTFLAAHGNIRALKKGIRFIDHDLNRMWIAEDVERILASDVEATSVIEYLEVESLARLLHNTIQSASEPIYFVDLHTTSSESPPFIYSVPCINAGGILPRFHIPIVTDPDQQIAGTMGQYVAQLGQKVIIAEGGHHDHHSSIDYCEAVLWLALEMAGCIKKEDTDGKCAWADELLHHGSGELPQYFEVVYRHPIFGGDGFRMKPGYHNFQPITRGEVLADDSKGEIVSQFNGWILMPLYRPPCEDGFFIVQERESRSTFTLSETSANN